MSTPLANPEPGPIRRWGKVAFRATADRGWFGLRPLETHLVICGFPRAGTTLAQLMIEACVGVVAGFAGEVDARWAAEHANRRHRWLVTKRPRDIEAVDGVRTWYATHPGEVLFLVMVRDPRDVLTSVHAGYPPSRGYYCDIERWRTTHRLIRSLAGDHDVCLVRYEDLVDDPDAVGHRLDERLRWARPIPFSEFHHHARPIAELPPVEQGALGGLRAPTPASSPRWAASAHRSRMAEVEAELGAELGEALAVYGYDRSSSLPAATRADG